MITHKKQSIFLFVFFVFAYSYFIPYNTASIGIDPAWHESLAMIIDQGLIFGRDFVFTYGPLGFINTKVYYKDFNIYYIIFFDTIYLLNIVYIIKYAFEQAGKKWIKIALISIYLFLPWGIFADVSFTYFYFIVFWILHSQATKTSIGLWISLFFSVLTFFIKVNLSLIIIFTYELSLIYLVFKRHIKWTYWFILTITLLFFIFILSFQLHVDIPLYLQNSIQYIDGYQDAMSIIIPKKNELIGIALLETSIIISIICVFFILRKELKQMILAWTLFGIMFFLNFKQAHTAISTLNLYGYFSLIPLLIILIYLFSIKEYKSTLTKYVLTIIALQTVSIQYLKWIDNDYSLRKYVNSLAEFKYNPMNYFEKIQQYDNQKKITYSSLVLPKKIKSLIKNQTVDILQSRIDYIYFNQLNYQPRPVIQSYCAYTPELIHLNGEMYRSKKSPQFVLFRFDDFREKNPFWSDSEVNLELLRRYELIDNFKVGHDSLLLFKKSNQVKKINVQAMHVAIQLNKTIPIPKSQVVQFFGHIDYSITGKLARLLFQPPYLHCQVNYEDGTSQSFRVIHQILQGGILINKKVTNHHELYNYYSSIGRSNKNVISLKFYSKLEWGFQ